LNKPEYVRPAHESHNVKCSSCGEKGRTNLPPDVFHCRKCGGDIVFDTDGVDSNV
jgi:ribosomal protein L37AE/L43A